MAEFDFDWVDAFTDRVFGGNGCAVVHGGAALPVAVCTAYVRETSLVECTFTGPSDVADIKVRYFLASREIPFAGHPTVATIVAMRQRGLIADGGMTLETGAGIVPIVVDGTRVTMTQIAPHFGAKIPADIVAAVGGLDPSEIVGQPQIVSTGLPTCVTILKNRAALDRVVFDVGAFKIFERHLGDEVGDVLEPFWVTLSGATEAGDTFARLLLAPPNPPEDPFTGSATGAMAAYLWANKMIETPQLVAEQGHGMGRPGQADVRVFGPRDAILGVDVSGKGALVMSGKVFLPET